MEAQLGLPNIVETCHRISPTLEDSVAQELQNILLGADVEGSFLTETKWLERLICWLRSPGKCSLPASMLIPEDSGAARLRLLLEVLKQHPTLARAVGAVFRSVADGSEKASLFCDTGLPPKVNLLDEGFDRFVRRFIPVHREDRDLPGVLGRLFPCKKAAAWLERIPTSLLAEFIAQIGMDDASKWRGLAEAMADSVEILAIRVSAIGLSEDLRRRSPIHGLRDSPFHRLPSAAGILVRAWHEQQGGEILARKADFLATVNDCRNVIAAILKHLDEHGVSIDLVYRLELLQRQLNRMESIMALLTPESKDTHIELSLLLLRGLVAGHLRDMSLRVLVQNNLGLLARKIADHTSHTGEHYIAENRKDWHGMISSAAGGGLLTAGTVLLKFKIAKLSLSMFMEGVLSTVNYAGSFLLMQAVGFTLATKQPPMTASVLASSLKEHAYTQNLAPLARLAARVTHSQVAAALGNIGAVIPTVFFIDLIYTGISGHHFLDEKKALYAIESLDPFSSGTILFAALTGMILWFSSLAAGWAQNMVRFRRIPDVLAGNRVLRWLAGKKSDHMQEWISHHVGGIAASTSLGFLLAFVPIFGRFVGFGIDVRHVTLSTGALTLACCAMGPSVIMHQNFPSAVLGIIIIGILNFGIGFLFALMVALRARGIGFMEVTRVFWFLIDLFLREPALFLIPPKDKAEEPPHTESQH